MQMERHPTPRPIFRIRIIAPMEYRVAMARQRLKFPEDEAVAYIEKMDAGRRKWALFLYGVDWTDPSLYDLVLNLERFDAQDAADTIAYVVRKQASFDFDARCQAAMDDLAVASRVRADLALNSATSHLELEVVSKDGCVSIAGKLSDSRLINEIKQVAAAAPGVKDVALGGVISPTPA